MLKVPLVFELSVLTHLFKEVILLVFLLQNCLNSQIPFQVNFLSKLMRIESHSILRSLFDNRIIAHCVVANYKYFSLLQLPLLVLLIFLLLALIQLIRLSFLIVLPPIPKFTFILGEYIIRIKVFPISYCCCRSLVNSLPSL